MPTAPIINIGPEVEQKLVILNASSLVILPSINKSDVNFAPTGYPEIILVKNTYEEIAGVLKRNLQGFENTFEILSIVPSDDKILEKIINGKMLGNTLKAHAVIPFKV